MSRKKDLYPGGVGIGNGRSHYVIKSSIEENADELGMHKLSMATQFYIPEEYFSWKKIMERKRRELPERKIVAGGLLEDVVMVAGTPSENLLNGSLGFRDFKIVTNDGFTIWCHKIILANNSSYFQTVVSADFKDARENRADVHFDKNSMMEVLHFM